MVTSPDVGEALIDRIVDCPRCIGGQLVKDGLDTMCMSCGARHVVYSGLRGEAESPETAGAACAHHWLIDEAGLGRCKLCPATREFKVMVQLSLTQRWCPECREWVVPGPPIGGRSRSGSSTPRLAELFGCPRCGALTKEKEA